MARTFFRKKFSNYLGEQRAVDDIVLFFTSDIGPGPTPTPSVTPSNTPTSTPSVTSTPTQTQTGTPTQTPTNTSTPTTTPTQTPGNPTPTPTTTQTQTPTLTPTITPYPICPNEIILDVLVPGYPIYSGAYARATISNVGNFDTAWRNINDGTINYGTAPNGDDYVAYYAQSGSTYYTIIASTDSMGNNVFYEVYATLGGTLFNGATTFIASLLLTEDIINDGVLYYPQQGNGSYSLSYISYPIICPTPTPTSSVTPTPTYTPTNTPTPTSTPVPSTAVANVTVTSVNCGGVALTGYSFTVSINGLSATTFDATINSDIACISGVTTPNALSSYLIKLHDLPEGLDLCDSVGVGQYNELYYHDLVFNTANQNWECTIDFRYNGTVLFSGPSTISFPVFPSAPCNRTIDFGVEVFEVTESFKLQTENSDFIQTESSDYINIEN